MGPGPKRGRGETSRPSAPDDVSPTGSRRAPPGVEEAPSADERVKEGDPALETFEQGPDRAPDGSRGGQEPGMAGEP